MIGANILRAVASLLCAIAAAEDEATDAENAEPLRVIARQMDEDRVAAAQGRLEELEQQTAELLEELGDTATALDRYEQAVRLQLEAGHEQEQRLVVLEMSISAKLGEIREAMAQTLPGGDVSGTRPRAGAADREGAGG